MGWASGLQSGIQLGNAIKQGQERRAMEEIQGTTAKEFQDYTPSQIQQIQGLQRTDAYDVQAIPGENGAAPTLRYIPKQGLDLQGDMPAAPIDVAPQRMTSFLGQRYEGDLSPERMEGIRTRAMANAITDPMRRQQALLAVTGEERAQAAEARAAEGFKTSQEAAGLQIRRGKREEDTENKILEIDKQAGDFMTKRLTGEDGNLRAADTDDMIAQIQHRATLLQQGGLGREATAALKDWQGVAVNAIQLNTATRNEELGRVATAIAAGDLKPAQAFYDKHVLDGAKVTALTTNKDGSISVSRVRDDGVKLPDTKVGSANELLATLNSFRDPMSLYNFSQNEFKNNMVVKELNIKQQSANQVGEYYKSRTGIEKMGSAQYFQGEDGNTYASVPVMGKEGLKFETVKVNPDDIKMKKAGATGNGNPVKIEEEGTKMSIGGKTVISDGNGNWIPADGNGRPQGVLPSERLKTLKDAGVPENLIGQLPWNKTGTGILFNGKEYDAKDPKDLKTLTETYKRLGAAGIAMEEDTKRSVGLQQQFRNLGGQKPSIYADPALWQLYRNQEANQGLMPTYDR